MTVALFAGIRVRDVTSFFPYATEVVWTLAAEAVQRLKARSGRATAPAELDARLAADERHARRRADRTLARTTVAMGL